MLKKESITNKEKKLRKKSGSIKSIAKKIHFFKVNALWLTHSSGKKDGESEKTKQEAQKGE